MLYRFESKRGVTGGMYRAIVRPDNTKVESFNFMTRDPAGELVQFNQRVKARAEPTETNFDAIIEANRKNQERIRAERQGKNDRAKAAAKSQGRS
jgi:hypothetical protein